MLRPYMMPRAWTLSRSRSASVTGWSGTRLPMAAFGSAAVASYARFCWSLTAHSSYTFSSSARLLPMAWVAAESVV
ncbi:hypothetical protein [Micromonospora sp. S4605]|uniref:hypothetical protein n=1 Tax=Micromonospora sp. S4605 TaxID=1420897 RepID=UPI001305481E